MLELIFLICTCAFIGACFYISNNNMKRLNNKATYIDIDKEILDDRATHIKYLIEYEELTDINEIAKLSNCVNINECIIKIQYLEKKKLIKNIHIDYKHGKLVKCSLEDEKLLNKYAPYIYHKKCSIDNMIVGLKKSSHQSDDYIRKQIYNDLLYLYNKNLIHGVKLNEVDMEVIYFSLDNKKAMEFITVQCPSCGALNELNHGNKVRCEYCDTIIDDTK